MSHPTRNNDLSFCATFHTPDFVGVRVEWAVKNPDLNEESADLYQMPENSPLLVRQNAKGPFAGVEVS